MVRDIFDDIFFKCSYCQIENVILKLSDSSFELTESFEFAVYVTEIIKKQNRKIRMFHVYFLLFCCVSKNMNLDASNW